MQQKYMLAVSRIKCLLNPTLSAFSSHLTKPTPLTFFSLASNPYPCNSIIFQNPSFLPLKPTIFSLKSSFILIQNRGMHVKVDPPSSTGEIHAIVGPMFSRKTVRLLRRIQSERSNGSFQVEHYKGYLQLDKTLKGLCVSGRLREAVGLLWITGVQVEPGTYALLLQECIFRKEYSNGRRIHGQMVVVGYDPSEYLKTKLLILYVKSGHIGTAHILFDKLLGTSLVSWNAMIAGYVQRGLEEVGLDLYYKMRWTGFVPDQHTFASVFRACATLATLEHGKRTHGVMIKCQVRENVVVNSALMDMYFKCSSLSDGHQVFEKSSNRNVITWTALISGYGQHGKVVEVLEFFHRMKNEGFKPNYVTFLAVISACSHGGLVDQGWAYFSSMTRDYGIEPRGKHYASMIDLLGRAGRLHEAYEFVLNSPCKEHSVIWGALLGACRIHGDMVLVKLAAKKFFELEPENPGKYVVLSNAYATSGLWDNAAEVRAVMRESGVIKEPGHSWLEIRNGSHFFFKGDKSHKQSSEIYEMIRRSFGSVLDRIPHADSVTRLTDHCELCHRRAFFTSSGAVRDFTDTAGNDDNRSESETEWERLIKPFDLKQLRKSLNQISPYQLCKLLELPLDVPTSMEIFKWAGAQKSYCHSFDVYYVLVDKLGAAGEFKVIDRLLGQMKDEGIVFRESLFLLIMKYYGRAGLPGQATRLLLDMRGLYSCEPTFRSYNVVLDILVAGNCPKVAPNVFYDMLSKGVSPTVYTFGVVMKALCMVNEVDSACSLLRDMTKHGCVPNSVVYQTLIHSLYKSERVNEALKLLDEMFLMGCAPDVQTFNDVIHGLCKLNRIQEAAKLVDRMLLRGFSPDNITYGVLMHGLCRMRQVNEARALLNKVPVPNVVLFNTLINGYVTCGRFEDAMAVMNDFMLNTICVPDVFTFNILVRGLCKKGCLASARELVNEMTTRGCEPNVVTYTILIDGFCKEGQLEEAGEALNEMSTKGLSLNTVGYNCLICALCKNEKVHEALVMIGEMSRKGCKPDIFTFNSVIFGLCKVGKMEEAMRVHHDMLLEGVIANSVTYNTLIHAFLRRGGIQEALKLVDEMLFRGCPLDVITYNGLMKALCKAGAIEKGLGLFEEMMSKGLNINNVSCNILINGLCRVGKVHNALEFLRSVIHRGLTPDIVTYNTLINGLCKMGRLGEALNLFDRIQIEGIRADAITYNTLIRCYCREGMFDDAYLFLREGVDNGFVPNDVTWYLLVTNFVRESAMESQTFTSALF